MEKINFVLLWPILRPKSPIFLEEERRKGSLLISRFGVMTGMAQEKMDIHILLTMAKVTKINNTFSKRLALVSSTMHGKVITHAYSHMARPDQASHILWLVTDKTKALFHWHVMKSSRELPIIRIQNSHMR